MAKQLHIRLNDSEYEAVTRYAEEREETVQNLVTAAIRQLLNKNTSKRAAGRGHYKG